MEHTMNIENETTTTLTLSAFELSLVRIAFSDFWKKESVIPSPSGTYLDELDGLYYGLGCAKRPENEELF